MQFAELWNVGGAADLRASGAAEVQVTEVALAGDHRRFARVALAIASPRPRRS